MVKKGAHAQKNAQCGGIYLTFNSAVVQPRRRISGMRKNAQCGLTGGVPDFREQSARARAHAREKGKLIRIERPRNVFAML